MAHQTAVDIIRVISEAVNPTGQFAYLRTWDASLEFNEVDQKIFLYPISGQVDITNGYFETWNCSMGFFFQDAPDSTNEQREQLITNADVLLKAFILAADTVDGVQFSIVRKRPVYRDMAGTYSGYLVDFTLSLTEDVCNGDTPSVIIPVGKTFCELVDECLGITESGSTDKFLNEKGEWVEVSGGGGAVIQVTKSEFLALVNSNGLTYPAIYKITDVDSGLFLNTLSENQFDADGIIILFVPDYEVAGNNLGQLNANDIQSVGAGQRVIWADYYWLNNTASPITPTIDDLTTLSGGLTLLDKVSGSIYLTKEFPCSVDDALNVAKIFNPNTSSEYLYVTEASADLYRNIAINNGNIRFSDLAGIINTFGAIGATRTNTLDLPIQNNSGSYSSIIIEAGGNEFSGNNIEGDGSIQLVKLGKGNQFKNNSGGGLIDSVTMGNSNQLIGNQIAEGGSIASIQMVNQSFLNNNELGAFGEIGSIQLGNNSKLNANKIIGSNSSITDASTCQIGFIELFDNCEMNGNELNGESSVIWDVRTGENCRFNNNIINSNVVNSKDCGFADVDMMQFDEVIGNELNGDDASVQVLNMFGYSKFNNNTFNGAMNGGSLGSFCQFQLYNSEITDNTFNQDFKYWREITMHNAKLRNATDIQVQNCTFDNIDLDLTGFTADIIGQTIQNGKGWFTYKHDFASSPLLTTDTLLHNIIPIGARITNLVISGATNGNSIQLGLSGDDESLLILPTSLLNNQLLTVSNAATLNRSLLIKALTDPVTIGDITIKCEFVC